MIPLAIVLTLVSSILVAVRKAVNPANVPTPSSGEDPSPSNDPAKSARKQMLWSMLRSLHQLTEDQRLFVMLVAYGETQGTWKSTSHNDTPSEVEASVKAWDAAPKLAARLTACKHGGKDAWAIGSGGYGGRLVPYFGQDMLDAKLPCDPQGVFEPKLSLLSSIITAHKLQQTSGWRKSAKMVKNLRAGYYGLGYIRKPPADRVEKYKRHAKAVGMSDTFVDQVLTEFPGPSQWVLIYQTLILHETAVA